MEFKLVDITTMLLSRQWPPFLLNIVDGVSKIVAEQRIDYGSILTTDIHPVLPVDLCGMHDTQGIC